MGSIKKYIKENVFCRCGQAVSLLATSQLVPRPELATSESEIYEWWLVSPDLAAKLRAARLPVLQFGELNMWGRTTTGVPLEDDVLVIAALGEAPTRTKARRATTRPQQPVRGRRKATTTATRPKKRR